MAEVIPTEARASRMESAVIVEVFLMISASAFKKPGKFSILKVTFKARAARRIESSQSTHDERYAMLLTEEGRRRDSPPVESGSCIMRSEIDSMSSAEMIEGKDGGF